MVFKKWVKRYKLLGIIVKAVSYETAVTGNSKKKYDPIVLDKT